MKVTIVEPTIKLRDLKPGEIAVSPDRKDVFACANFTSLDGKIASLAIFKLNSLTCQYQDNWDYDRPVVKITGHNVILST
jgi:hypothetical protein